MGFSLEKVVVGASPEGGWAKHFFYDTGHGNGNGLIAFWELHDASNAKVEGVQTAISTDLGLPAWVNHLAFDAATLDDLAWARDRWLRNGYDVVEIDHEFCVSIYTDDPNGILVEFCCTTREFDDNDRAEAQKRLLETNPSLDPDPKVEFHLAAAYSPA